MNDLTHLAITSISDDQIINIVSSTVDKLFFMAPGLSCSVAVAIAKQWKKLGPHAVNIVLDVDAEVIRLGYGDVKALMLLQTTSDEIGAHVCNRKGIRIGVIVADNEPLVFAPTPLTVESNSSKLERINAVRYNTLPDNFAEEANLNNQESIEQSIGLDKVSSADVEKVVADLAENPPVKFDSLQKLRVFNAAFEFVEFRLEGCSISRKTVPIPSDLIGLGKDPKTQKLLRSTYRLIDNEDKQLSGEEVSKVKDWIANAFLVSLPGYGNIVLGSNKADFLADVETLKHYVDRFQIHVEAKLQDAIDKNRKALVEALFPAVAINPPSRSIRHLGPNPDGETIKVWLDMDLAKIFGTASDCIGNMEIIVIFKAVTYELLNDPKFIETAKKALPNLKVLHKEFDAAKTTTVV